MRDRRAERAAAKRRRDRRGTRSRRSRRVVVLGGLAALVLTSPRLAGGPRDVLRRDVFKESFPDVAKAFWLDIRVFMVVEVAVLVLGLVVALIRTSPLPALFPLRLLAVVYVDVFRGIPTILLVYLVGFGVPALGRLAEASTLPAADRAGRARRDRADALLRRLRRRGLPGRDRSVHRGQRDAALAIGLTEAQAMRHVILPQAVRRVGPPLLNDFIALQKDVALISILGVTGGGVPDRPDHPGLGLQLHAAGRRRAALPGGHDPAGAAARPLGRGAGSD